MARSTTTRRSRAPLVLVAVLGLAACTADGQPPTPAEPEPITEDDPKTDPRAGGTLRVGLSLPPASIDPRFVEDAEGELVVGAVFEPLVRLDPQQRVVPGLAEHWERDEAGQTWIFHLREASFHDGSPVTAADVARAFHRIADGTAQPRSYLAYLLEPVVGFEHAQRRGGALAGVEVVDEATLRLELDRPEPTFLHTLAHPALAPVPAIADDDPEAFARQPIGNGPFSVTEPVNHGGFVRLSRNAEHPSEPLLDAVVLQAYADDRDREQQWQDLLDGQLHVAEVPVEHLDQAVERFGRSADGYRGPGLLSGVSSTVYLYGFDLGVEPFDDARVRRAVSLSIDRARIAEEIFEGTRRAADAIVPSPMAGSQPGACDHCHHDPDAARELLAEAEEVDGVTFDELTLTYNQGRTHTAIAERMAADIEQALGIQVSLDGLELSRFFETVRDGQAEAFRIGLDPDRADAGAYLYPLLHSSSIGLENLMGYADSEVDALLDQARSHEAPDAEQLWQQVEQRALDDVAVIPVLHYRHNRVVAEVVRDLYWSPSGRLDLARVWLEDDV